jgi:hypothetical protein
MEEANGVKDKRAVFKLWRSIKPLTEINEKDISP